MKLLVYFIGLTIIPAVLCDNCDKFGIILYEDLGCTAVYGESKTCPIKYSCKGLEPSQKNCYFRNKSYSLGENAEDDSTCNVGCTCIKLDGRTGFGCAILDCPEWLGAPIRLGCYRKYSVDQCCSTGQICPPFDENAKCVVKGKEYREGERFYPENTCLSCVCQRGFKGKFEEPFCKRTTCGEQLRRSSGESIQNGCAPLYGKKSDGVLCCPNNWICPNGSETIKGEIKREDECKFGSKTLKVGQSFEKLNVDNPYGRKIKKAVCECVIPPLLTCNEV